MAKAEYRSSIRSKNLIKKALAKLLHEKDLSKITVSDIIREADISRGTFYAHFPDVAGVVEQIEKEELEKVMALLDGYDIEPNAAEIDKLLQLACEYMSRDMEYYRMLTQSNLLNNFVVRLINIYYDKLFDSLHEKYPDYDRNEIDLYLLYISSGTKTVLMGWLNGDIKGAPSDISAKLGRLINCSRSFL